MTVAIAAIERDGALYCSVDHAYAAGGKGKPRRVPIAEYRRSTDVMRTLRPGEDPVEARPKPNWGALCAFCEDELPGYGV